MKRELTVPRRPKQSIKDPQFWECDVINGGTRVAKVSWPNDLEALRFARLFAAAPELLAACKRMYAAVDAIKSATNAHGEGTAIKMAKAAIAKAEGKAA